MKKNLLFLTLSLMVNLPLVAADYYDYPYVATDITTITTPYETDMAKDKVIGRVAETGILEKALHSAEPEFIAVYGRRRVGKTFLIGNITRIQSVLKFQAYTRHLLKYNFRISHYRLKTRWGLG